MSRILLRSTAVFAFVLASFASTSSAQVVYTDIEPDVRLEGWEAHPLDLGPEPNTTLYIWKHPNEVVINTMTSSIEVLYDGQYPAALEEGATISSAGDWRKPAYHVLNHEGTTGNWIGVTDRYLGVRYKSEGMWHYTWVRMDVDAAPNSFTLKDYAEEEAPGAEITAGEKSSASVEEEVSEGWTINGREISAKSDCTIRVASIDGSVVIDEELDAGDSFTIAAQAGAYLISIQNAKMSEVMKVVLR